MAERGERDRRVCCCGRDVVMVTDTVVTDCCVLSIERRKKFEILQTDTRVGGFQG
jgi:hypothetical protein